MIRRLLFAVALTSVSTFFPALGAPIPKPKAPPKAVVDPLAIPAFAPIPNEFVFAGTQKDVYKLLERYTGGVSLDKLPEAKPEEIKASKEPETVQALLDVKHILAPLHVIRVRSVSYKALGETAEDKAYEDLAPKTEQDKNSPSPMSEMDRRNRGWKRSKELLQDAETFYKNLLVKQGGQVQMQLGGETSITVYALAQQRTFAVVTRGPSRVIVARADGKPDVGAITNIFQKVIDN